MNLHQILQAIFRPTKKPTVAPRPRFTKVQACYCKKAVQACSVLHRRMNRKPGGAPPELTGERIKDRKGTVYGYTTAGNIVRL